MLPDGRLPLDGERLDGERLDGERLLLYDRGQYPDYGSRVTGYFKDQKIQAKVAGEFDGIASRLPPPRLLTAAI